MPWTVRLHLYYLPVTGYIYVPAVLFCQTFDWSVQRPPQPGESDYTKDGGREIEKEGEGDTSVRKKVEVRQTAWPLSDI